MKELKAKYLLYEVDVATILDKDNLQQVIDGLQALATQANLPASEIKPEYSPYDSGCDEFSAYYERLETDEEYQERTADQAKYAEYRKKMKQEEYLRLKDEFTELGLLDDTGNLINPED